MKALGGLLVFYALIACVLGCAVIHERRYVPPLPESVLVYPDI